MKVNELREKLSKLKKEELVKVASEFYKLIPKAKKEDYDLDSYINNPRKKQKGSRSKEVVKLEEIEIELKEFIKNAKNQYYLFPNRIVPKKQRSTWRFKVKKWYKELSNTRRPDKNLSKQSKLLHDLYELMCESCGYQYFSAHDSFQSIGIGQAVFYRSVIDLLQETKGKTETVKQCIELIVNNYLNGDTLYSTLMIELINTFETVDLKYNGIEVVEDLIESNNFKPKEKNKKKYYSYSSEEYRSKEKNNNLSKLGLRLHISLYEIEEGIKFYHKYHYNRDEEIKLYILIRILIEKGKKDQILSEIEKAIKQGIQPRDKLMSLMTKIKNTDELPKYI